MMQWLLYLCAIEAILSVAEGLGDHEAPSLMKKVIVEESIQSGGVCLDGTPAGYYWRQHKDEKAKDKWVISIFGGGWCYDEEQCYARSSTQLGSSSLWANEINGTGVMSGDPSVNPDFADWNAVHLFYCDGASLSGNRDKPVVVKGKELWFRGHRVLDAILNDLKAKKNLGAASHVLLTGCSAGGLSTFLHADYVRSVLPQNTIMKAMPQSGFFLPEVNLDGEPVYIDEMKYVFDMQNATHGVNEECIKDQEGDNRWRCMFAPWTYRYMKTPTFILNSYYDSWQMANILGARVVQFKNCSQHGPKDCTAKQIAEVNEWQKKFLNYVENTDTFKNPHNGVFLHSCWTHCFSLSDHYWAHLTVDGVAMRSAVHDWFFEKSSENNNHIGCELKEQSPHQCNPTCPK